jgi:hypothetical protein
MDLYDIFNKQLTVFVKDLVEVFPGIQAAAMMTTLAISMDKTTIAKMFYEKVTRPFGDKIDNKDETFFKEYSFQNEVSESDYGMSLDVVGQIKGIYDSMNEDNKQAIWKHMTNLTTISRKIAATSD